METEAAILQSLISSVMAEPEAKKLTSGISSTSVSDGPEQEKPKFLSTLISVKEEQEIEFSAVSPSAPKSGVSEILEKLASFLEIVGQKMPFGNAQEFLTEVVHEDSKSLKDSVASDFLSLSNGLIQNEEKNQDMEQTILNVLGHLTKTGTAFGEETVDEKQPVESDSSRVLVHLTESQTVPENTQDESLSQMNSNSSFKKNVEFAAAIGPESAESEKAENKPTLSSSVSGLRGGIDTAVNNNMQITKGDPALSLESNISNSAEVESKSEALMTNAKPQSTVPEAEASANEDISRMGKPRYHQGNGVNDDIESVTDDQKIMKQPNGTAEERNYSTKIQNQQKINTETIKVTSDSKASHTAEQSNSMSAETIKVAPDSKASHTAEQSNSVSTETIKVISDSKANHAAEQSNSMSKENEEWKVKSGNLEPVASRRTESESQNNGNGDLKTGTNVLKSAVSSHNFPSNPEIAAKAVKIENPNRDSASQEKGIAEIHVGKASDPDKGATERLSGSVTREHAPLIIDADTLKRYLSNNPSIQNTHHPDKIVNVTQLMSTESGADTDNLSAYHQPSDKNVDAMVNSKAVKHFEQSFQPTVMKQVVEKAILSLKNGQSSIKLNLRPEVLGQMKMHILTENNQVIIRIITDVPMVKDIIEGNLSQLKADFQNQGLEIEKFDVSVGQGSTHNHGSSGRLPFWEKTGASMGEKTENDISEAPGEPTRHAESHGESNLINYFA